MGPSSMHMDTMHFQHSSQLWQFMERNSSSHHIIMEGGIRGSGMSFSWDIMSWQREFFIRLTRLCATQNTREIGNEKIPCSKR